MFPNTVQSGEPLINEATIEALKQNTGGRKRKFHDGPPDFQNNNNDFNEQPRKQQFVLHKDKYKTSLCNMFQEGHCRHGERCVFAHGESELRAKPDTKKTACKFWTQGHCRFGEGCKFGHDGAQQGGVDLQGLDAFRNNFNNIVRSAVPDKHHPIGNCWPPQQHQQQQNFQGQQYGVQMATNAPHIGFMQNYGQPVYNQQHQFVQNPFVQQQHIPVVNFNQGQAPPVMPAGMNIPGGPVQNFAANPQMQNGQVPIPQMQNGQAPMPQMRNGQAPVPNFNQQQQPMQNFNRQQQPMQNFNQQQHPMQNFNQQQQQPMQNFNQQQQPIQNFNQQNAQIPQQPMRQNGQAPQPNFNQQNAQAPQKNFNQQLKGNVSNQLAAATQFVQNCLQNAQQPPHPQQQPTTPQGNATQNPYTNLGAVKASTGPLDPAPAPASNDWQNVEGNSQPKQPQAARLSGAPNIRKPN